jgi:hypothetical protein
MPSHTKLRHIVRIISVILLFALLTFAGYRNRCKLFTCQPATWANIHTIAQTQAAKAGPSYRIGIVRAKPAFRTTLLADGPDDITLSLELISAQPDMAHDGLYPVQMVEFADRDQWITWQNQGEWTSELPSTQAQQHLSRVRVSPRDVYHSTWNAAQRELSSSIRLSGAWMTLYINELPQERFGIESAWAISYSDGIDYLTYWIDAQSGKVVEQTKERFRKP